jgi:hypothetical protein
MALSSLQGWWSTLREFEKHDSRLGAVGQVLDVTLPDEDKAPSLKLQIPGG